MDNSWQLEIVDFERELSLEELLSVGDLKLADKVLTGILGSAYEVVTPQGQLLLGTELASVSQDTEIILELESIGFLRTSHTDPELFKAAKHFVLLEIRIASKYLMASALHIQAIQADYEALCEEHKALARSEAKYKELSEALDDKVKAQVKTIESGQRQLFESEKLASVGRLAAGMAHEINNPIGFINSNLSTATDYVADLSEFRARLTTAEGLADARSIWLSLDLDNSLEDFSALILESMDGGQRIARIVADLKLFSNVDAEEQVVINLEDYIEASCGIARSAAGSGVVIELLQQALPDILCRPAYIGQVILALVLNASHAMNQSGRIQIRSYVDSRGVVIDVEDEGPGIPDDVLQNVFDPFYTTKTVGEGKGLGLTSCRDIVLAHGGDIALRSRVGQGTTATFWLPLSAGRSPEGISS